MQNLWYGLPQSPRILYTLLSRGSMNTQWTIRNSPLFVCRLRNYRALLIWWFIDRGRWWKEDVKLETKGVKEATRQRYRRSKSVFWYWDVPGHNYVALKQRSQLQALVDGLGLSESREVYRSTWCLRRLGHIWWFALRFYILGEDDCWLLCIHWKTHTTKHLSGYRLACQKVGETIFQTSIGSIQICSIFIYANDPWNSTEITVGQQSPKTTEISTIAGQDGSCEADWR